MRKLMPATILFLLALLPGAALADPSPHSVGEREGPPLPNAVPTAPVRARRPWALSAELGNKGLAGYGLVATYNVVPRLSLDLGAGYSLLGYKAGGRVRLNFLESPWTPYLAAGGLAATGIDDAKVRLHSDSSRIRVRPSSFLQFATGVNYTGNGGFTFMSTIGYALLLRDDNVVLRSGHPLSKSERAELAGSGLLFALSMGYAF